MGRREQLAKKYYGLKRNPTRDVAAKETGSRSENNQRKGKLSQKLSTTDDTKTCLPKEKLTQEM